MVKSASRGCADRTVDAAYPKSADEMALVQSAIEDANSLPFRAAVGDAQFRLSQLPYVYAIQSPYTPANRSQISADGHSALTRFDKIPPTRALPEVVARHRRRSTPRGPPIRS